VFAGVRACDLRLAGSHRLQEPYANFVLVSERVRTQMSGRLNTTSPCVRALELAEDEVVLSNAERSVPIEIYTKPLPLFPEPYRNKVHWEHLLEEMAWLAKDFVRERKFR